MRSEVPSVMIGRESVGVRGPFRAHRSAVLEGRRRRSHPRVPDGDESAVTIIELLVALFIIGIVLSAAAASLITFTQTARQNERQAQATAVLNQAHERFQGQAWELLGTLPSDLCDGAAVDLSSSTHLGGALVLDDCEEWRKLESDETPTGDPVPMTFTGSDGQAMSIVLTGDEASAIPALDVEPSNDGRDYTLYQIVAWVDLDGDGNPDAKRLTAILRWEILNRTFEQVFISDRAPSVQEAGDPAFPRLLQFDRFPPDQPLDEDGFSTLPIDVVVRFSDPVKNVTVEFFSVDTVATAASGEVVLVNEAVAFGTPVISDPDSVDPAVGLLFSTSIPPGTYAFPIGDRPLRVVATTLADEVFVAGSRNVRFVYEGEGEAPFPPTPDPGSGDDGGGGGGDDGSGVTPTVSVGPVTVAAPPNPVGLDNDSGTRQLCGDITVSFNVSGGLQNDDTVSIDYFVGNKGNVPASQNLVVNAASGSQNFIFTFVRGGAYDFENNSDTLFTAKVLRDGVLIGFATSDSAVSFTNNNNC